MCQCPKTGNSHFHPRKSFDGEKFGVNALRRATLISTLSPQNPLFFNGFRSRFCRYFSEYSEKGLFHAIFDPVYNLDIFSSGW